MISFYPLNLNTNVHSFLFINKRAKMNHDTIKEALCSLRAPACFL